MLDGGGTNGRQGRMTGDGGGFCVQYMYIYSSKSNYSSGIQVGEMRVIEMLNLIFPFFL